MTVRVQKPGGKSRIARPEDVLDLLEAGLAAPPGSKEQKWYFMWAPFCLWLVQLNRGIRDDRRGSGALGRPPHDDSEARALMGDIANFTGESNARKLAQQAIDSGHVPLNGAKKESVVRRLASSWGKVL